MITLRHRIEYALLLFLKFLVRITPYGGLDLFTASLRWLAKKLDKRRHRLVNDNLSLAFPELEKAQRQSLLDRIYRHYSKIMTEWLYMFSHRCRPAKALPVSLVHAEHLQTVLELNQGAILVSAHFGNWELIPFVLKELLPSPLIAIARPMNNPLVERLVSRFRAFMGSQIIYKKGALRKIIGLLNERRFIYLLADQNAVPREAVQVDFFSRKTTALASVAQIHQKKAAPLLPLFLHYETERIVLEFLPPVLASGPERTVQTLTQELTGLIEQQIRKHPEQWFWFHNRWKNRTIGASL